MELPLIRFIDISIDKNLSLLDKSIERESGAVSDIPLSELQSEWHKIEMEFTDIMDTGTISDLYRSFIEMEGMKLKLSIVISAMDFFNKQGINDSEKCSDYAVEVISILRGIGFRLKFDFNNKQAFEQDMKRLVSLSKNISVQIAMHSDKMINGIVGGVSKAIYSKPEPYYEFKDGEWQKSVKNGNARVVYVGKMKGN
jgi:hypothetical protein